MLEISSPRRRAGALAALLLVCGATLHPAAADEVRLTNGDRLTGTAVRLADGKLTFKTDYAGEIGLDWGQVVALATDEPVRVVLADGTRIEGTLSPAPAPPAAAAGETVEAPWGPPSKTPRTAARRPRRAPTATPATTTSSASAGTSTATPRSPRTSSRTSRRAPRSGSPAATSSSTRSTARSPSRWA